MGIKETRAVGRKRAFQNPLPCAGRGKAWQDQKRKGESHHQARFSFARQGGLAPWPIQATKAIKLSTKCKAVIMIATVRFGRFMPCYIVRLIALQV